ncbi:PTS transporter subunit EIIC [Lachnospiraceae bacterium 54-53]
MKTIMYWLENSFAPKMNKLANNPWVAAVSSSMMKILPFILTGSLIFFYNVFRTYIPVLPDLSIVLTFTFSMLSLILVFMVGNQAMDKLGHPQYQISAGLTSIITYIMFTKPDINGESIMTVDFSRFGPSGMFVAVAVGLFVSLVFHLVGKLRLLENSTSVPDFVSEWINNIIPIFISVTISMIIINKLNIDIYHLILLLFEPLKNFGFTLPGFILICLIPAFLFSMGISTWFFGAVSTPILLAGTAANIAAAAAGAKPPYIVCYETIYALSLIPLGGTGATLPLNLMMMFSKSARLKTMGRIFIGPSIFNINEPITFGAPVVFNPLLMLPMWINSITGPVIIWFAMKLNALAVPAAAITTGQVPAPVAYLLITSDFRALIFYIILFIVYWVTWYPFFKVYEKKVIKEEREETNERYSFS